MAAKSYTHDDNILNFFLRGNPGAITSPASVEVGLFTVAPSNPGDAGTECSGGGYARVAATFAAPVNGSTSNSMVVTFPTATLSWGVVVAAGVFDNSGTLLYYGNLTASKTIDPGDTASFAMSALTITEQ